jgi:hypothetical protein
MISTKNSTSYSIHFLKPISFELRYCKRFINLLIMYLYVHNSLVMTLLLPLLAYFDVQIHIFQNTFHRILLLGLLKHLFGLNVPGLHLFLPQVMVLLMNVKHPLLSLSLLHVYSLAPLIYYLLLIILIVPLLNLLLLLNNYQNLLFHPFDLHSHYTHMINITGVQLLLLLLPDLSLLLLNIII